MNLSFTHVPGESKQVSPHCVSWLPPPADPPPPPRPPPRPARAPRAMRRPAAAGFRVRQCPTCQQEFRPTDIGQHAHPDMPRSRYSQPSMSFLQQAVSEYPSQKKPRTVFSCTGIPPSWPHQNHPKTGGAPSLSSYRRQHFSWSYVVCPRLDSYVVQTFGNCFTRLALDPTMTERPAPGRGDKQVLKGQVKKCEERLRALEERMERVELRQELSEAYRRLRVEHCNAFKTVWDGFEAKAFPPGELRQRAAKAVEDEVRQQLYTTGTSRRNPPTKKQRAFQ